MRKVAFFGGTFDPIHLGHLNLAIQLAEIHKLDEVLFCPANFSPHKQNNLPQAPSEHRSAMVQLAIAPIESFNILEYELEKSGPSFTIDSLRMLTQAYPKTELFLILGQLQGVDKWKEIEALLSLAKPLVGSRKEKQDIVSGLSEKAQKAIKAGITPISIMEISSTEIRARLKQKKYCGHLLPEKVLNYIYEHNLYD